MSSYCAHIERAVRRRRADAAVVRLRHVLNALERGTALNWLVDNFQRRSDWRAATHRVAALPLALDQIECGHEGRAGRPAWVEG